MNGRPRDKGSKTVRFTTETSKSGGENRYVATSGLARWFLNELKFPKQKCTVAAFLSRKRRNNGCCNIRRELLYGRYLFSNRVGATGTARRAYGFCSGVKIKSVSQTKIRNPRSRVPIFIVNATSKDTIHFREKK